MRQVAVVYKRTGREAASLADRIRSWFQQRGVSAICAENPDRYDVSCSYQKMDLPNDTDLVIVLGGDGTLLSVARLLEHRTAPLLGVNLGGLGFLTETNEENCFERIRQVLEGDCEIEERMRLAVSIHRKGERIFTHTVLNDAVVNKGTLARIIDLKATVDGRFLTVYRGDGLIMATPTGSTAYNLSAGGPIVYPTATAIILAPICPFTLTNRPIIFPGEASIEVQLGERLRNVTLTCDGQVGCELYPLDTISVTAAPNPLRVIKTPSIDYFKILRTKLKWGQNSV